MLFKILAQPIPAGSAVERFRSDGSSTCRTGKHPVAYSDFVSFRASRILGRMDYEGRSAVSPPLTAYTLSLWGFCPSWNVPPLPVLTTCYWQRSLTRSHCVRRARELTEPVLMRLMECRAASSAVYSDSKHAKVSSPSKCATTGTSP